MYGLYDLELARVRREELLREAEQRRLARALRGGYRKDADGRRDGTRGSSEGIRVRWGLAEDEPAVADLLELNGMPRWIAFEERFVVAEEDGQVLGAVRYRTEKERLLLGLLAVEPWAGEERVALALYARAGNLARELGVGEVVASGSLAGYPRLAGYRRWGRGWRFDLARDLAACGEIASNGWRRVLSLFGALPVPFHRYW